MTTPPVLSESAQDRPQSTTFAGTVAIFEFSDVPDLERWIDPRLQLVHGDRAFFKFYALRRRPHGVRVDVRFLQYHQVCLTTLATFDDGPPMHVNLIMWEDKDWAALANRAAMGWPKRMADIVGTWLFPFGAQNEDLDPDLAAYDYSVIRHGIEQLGLHGELEAWGTAPEPPPFDGFLTVRPPVPFSDDESRPIFEVRPFDWHASPIAQGTARLAVGDRAAPDEPFAPADIIGRRELIGSFGVHHVRWTIDPSVNRRLA